VPVMDLTTTWLHPGTRPDWLETTAVGRFRLEMVGARFERHHHSDHELWFIVAGKGKVLTDGVEQYVQAGDLVITRAGDSHDFIEIYETIDGLFIETGHPDGGTPGHLYADDAARGGHDVPFLPEPADFPARTAQKDASR
jgi:mannose-6-phosphate isomerase-like protein (cupin superfamily)